MMPVATKVGVGVHLKTVATFGVKRDSLRIYGLEIIDQVDYCVPV